ncbi:MAG: DEAD/DEAH box helicase [Clostridia bacterium]|nr:DEAD/DEAH box helicase [Clostridia bacterium]
MEITKIRGVNEKREQEFNKLGIYDTADLIRYFPRAYLDLREQQPLKYAYHNDVVLTAGKIISIPVSRHFCRGGLVKVICEQEGFFFHVVWFNQPYVINKLKVGEEYLFYGRVQNTGEISLVNPTFEPCEKVFRLQGIVPQYSIKGSLNQKLVMDACRLSVDLEKPKSIIPFNLLAKYGLSDLYSAYKEVHNPAGFDSLKRASERIAVEEYFALISAFKFIKGGREQVRINKYSTTAKELLQFISTRFPFDFTDGQKTAVNEIFADMAGEKVMNRLMQGDVGSGKTAVSMCALFIAVNSGFQAVMLAPTEVLARQNYNAVVKTFPDFNIGLITGSMTVKEKREIKQAAKLGMINILVGTHAVLQDDVEFKKLSLCVCDEQQRFGVAQ